MENRFNNRDFEQFVKQNADQYRMFPSDKVWNNIHSTLHTRRRWYGIGLGLLLLSAGVVTWVMVNSNEKNNQIVRAVPAIKTQHTIVAKKKITPPLIVKETNSKTYFITSTDKLQKDLFIDNSASSPTDDEGINQSLAIRYNEAAPVTKPEIINHPEFIQKKTVPSVKQVANINPIGTPVSSVKITDNSLSINNTLEKLESVSPINEEKVLAKTDVYPFSIESVINSYRYVPKRKKISLQVYLTPSISYRDLKENKEFINSAQIAVNGLASNYSSSDINNIVTHKPDIGLQLGFTFGYPLSKKLKLIGGLQFNISKYDIKAYSFPSEVATIALRSSYGGTNTVSTMTNYRNTGGGFKADWLRNLYFSASAPIGLEMKLIGNRKTYMGISGTVQPSYIIRNRSYLLSTDYKNYAEVPSLIRRWNINTGFEVFAGYSTGKLKWRVGPQIRYQAMSSFQKKYPVQEHLFDFGLKMGIMLNK